MRSLALLAAACWMVMTGCTAPAAEEDEASGNAAVTGEPLDVAEVKTAIASLKGLRDGELLRPYASARVEGCWRNPAGNKLTDLKKAFYCSMPLEFRLCNTIVLLTTTDAKVEERKQGYFDCKRKVDAVFGGRGLFAFDAKIDAVYEALFLKDGTLSTADTQAIVAANKPVFGSHAFATLLVEIGLSLTKEAADLAIAELLTLADDYKDAAANDPR